ncbi:MAG: DNA translocase FtsK 4TM domain-containing protein [Candidatus Paceibacterota bacterium]
MGKKKKKKWLQIPDPLKGWIWGTTMFLIAVLILLSFFEKAGMIGSLYMKGGIFLVGRAVFLSPLLFVIVGLVFLGDDKNRSLGVLGVLFLVLSLAGLLDLSVEATDRYAQGAGGWIGKTFTNVFGAAIGTWGSAALYFSFFIIGFLSLFHVFWPDKHITEIVKSKGDDIKEKAKEKAQEGKEKIKEKKDKVKEKAKEKASERADQAMESIEVKSVDESKSKKNEPKFQEEPEQDEEEDSIKPEPVKGDFKSPPLDLLAEEDENPSAGNIKNNSQVIKRTLQDFDIEVEMSEVNVGPTVTQYTLKPAQGVKLSKIEARNEDLALALARHPVRVQAPIPGRSLVGVEVPNEVRARVRLRDLLEKEEYQEGPALNIALGKDVSGDPVFANLADMPHLLVAGSTGSGKTVCLNSILLSLLYNNNPDSLRLILVDPKRVEFPVYEGLPHLLGDVIVEPDQSVRALKWLISEMERRFDLMSDAKTKDIRGYNKQEDDKLPYIVLVVDELADLMAAKGSEMEEGIVRLAQMARAVGIHLIVATQRPSVEVVTGLIKANITSRISFQVASQVDSRTVLDKSGAEKLLGSGDMLFVSSSKPKPQRIQGAYVSQQEIKKVIKWLEEQVDEEEEEEEEDELSQELEEEIEEEEGKTLPGEDDELYEEAKDLVIKHQKGSASFLQRRMRVGYARAARLIDALAKNGIVGEEKGSKPRDVLVDKEGNKEDKKF